MRSLKAENLKQANRIHILHLIRRGEISRAKISATLGMSKPNVSLLVEELIQEGLVIETGYGKSSDIGGKRPILLELNAQAGWIAAIHFNEETVETALTDLRGRVLLHARHETQLHDNYEDTFQPIIRELLEQVSALRDQGYHQPLLACGISCKGYIHTASGTLRFTSAIPQWKDAPIAHHVSSKLNIPVFMENDARALALADIYSEREQELETFVSVSIGLGIGTGVVVNKEIYRGAFDGAVNFGHTMIVENGPVCDCGNQGCWEALASLSAMMRELQHRLDDDEIDLDWAVEQFHFNHRIVREVVLEYTGYWLGVGISNLINIFNPEEIILKGDITLFGAELLQKVEKVAITKASALDRIARITMAEPSSQLHIQSAAFVAIKPFFSIDSHDKIWATSRILTQAGSEQ